MIDQKYFATASWDSNFFGFPIGRIISGRITAEISAALPSWAKENKIRCMYFLCDSSSEESFDYACKLGFQLIDIRMTLHCNLTNSPVTQSQKPSNWHISYVESCAPEPLAEISRGIYRDSRFYTDRKFDSKKADELFTTWVTKSCKGMADGIVIAKNTHGEVCGYVTLHRTENRNPKIGLFCVSASSSGRGLGGEMLSFLKSNILKDEGDLEVVTQGRNIPAQRLYQKHDFRTSQVQLWFHRWFY